jgi:hypothetical protein
MSIDKIYGLVKSFIKVMPKGYDEETYINQIIPCVFIGGFCAELAELMSSSFIINRIGEAIEKYLNSILRGGQKINKDNLPSIISKIKEIIEGERKKANDSNPKLYISLNSDIDMLIEYHINANETITQDTITNIKSILYGIEGYKDINTLLYDTKLVRGTSVSVRSNEFKDLSRYFTNQADFDEYCDKYYKGNMQDCDKSSKSAKDVMGNVVDKINQNNIILSIGNLAATALVDTIADLIKIKDVDFSGCARIIFELSNDLFLIVKYVEGKKEIVDNVKKMSEIVIKSERFYAKKQSVPSQLPESFHESSQESHEIPQLSRTSYKKPRQINELSKKLPSLLYKQEILNLQGQITGGSKLVSKVINRYLDKIKEVRAIIKGLNDNKKKNKSKILTKRMQIKNLYSKIKIQKEKERQRVNAKKAK